MSSLSWATVFAIVAVFAQSQNAESEVSSPSSSMIKQMNTYTSHSTST